MARVHDVTTESKIAEMRMKFWEEAVDRIYGDSEKKSVPDHPVVTQLKKVGPGTLLTAPICLLNT